jgi:hypothetical protein
MKRSRVENESVALAEYVATLSLGIKREYKLHKRRQQRYNKTVNAIMQLLTKKGYQQSLIQQSTYSIEL